MTLLNQDTDTTGFALYRKDFVFSGGRPGSADEVASSTRRVHLAGAKPIKSRLHELWVY
jgi:hypothetical protein